MIVPSTDLVTEWWVKKSPIDLIANWEHWWSTISFKCGNVVRYCLGHIPTKLGRFQRQRSSNAGKWRWISVWFWWSSVSCPIMYSNCSQPLTSTFLNFGKTVPQLLPLVLSWWSPMSIITMCLNSWQFLIHKISNNILGAVDRVNNDFIFETFFSAIAVILHKICDGLERHWARSHMSRGYEFDSYNYIIS